MKQFYIPYFLNFYFTIGIIDHALSEEVKNSDLSHRNPYLLNLTVVPLHYTVRLRPVLQDGFPGLRKFTSPSEITIRVQSITNGNGNHITLHQRNLSINLEDVNVRNAHTGQNLAVASQTFELERDLYTIKLHDSFNFGETLDIYIPYVVNISETENVGIYVGHYVDPETDETRYLSATKLEPYHARKVFPLFDEPSLKAKWRVIVGRIDDGKYHSLSNMEIERTEKDTQYEGWVWDHYHDTVLMSPYLVCVIVSDFVNETVYLPGSNKRVTTWAPRHFISGLGGSYGAQTASKILTFFEKKFKMSYPLKKLDAVALPQFPTGATENFGVVTYRHKNLIWIPGEDNEYQRRKITQVLSHEIAHQWYGNLVTCAWWSEIWLNEGFARFLQFWAMREMIPEFKVEEAFVNDVTQAAMMYDQSFTIHPLKNSAQSPDESVSVFNKITYDKGAAMLKMMEVFLTREVFEAGIIDIYLQRMYGEWKWRSAYQEDLFQALQEAVESHDVTYLLPPNTTVQDIMTPWTNQSGFPLIKVKIVDQRTIAISQEKFTINPNRTSSSKWWIPISILSENANEDGKPIHISAFWLPRNITNVKFSSPNINTDRRWIMLNPNATGFYRVLYDSNLTGLIREQLLTNHRVISSSSRSQLFDDYFYFALAKYIPIKTVLEATKYLGKEMDANVWRTVLGHLKNLYGRFREDNEAQGLYKDYFLPKIEQALGLIGERQGADERGINVTLRAQLYDLACLLDSPLCWEYASELLLKWEETPKMNPFPLDLQPVLYCAAVASASVSAAPNSAYNFIMKRYLESKRDAERAHLVKAMTCSRNVSDLENLLETAIISDSRDYFTRYTKQILASVVMYPPARTLVSEFVKKALTMKRISTETFSDVVRFLSGIHKRPEGLNELQEFIKNYENSLNSTEKEKQVIKDLKSSIQTSSSYAPCIRCGDWWNSVGKEMLVWLTENRNDEIAREM